MTTQYIGQRANQGQPIPQGDLLALLVAIQADLVSLRTAVNAHSHGALDAAANAGTMTDALKTQP